MARYWIEDTGNWNDTTQWSDSSGGASGSTVPTSGDTVYFDENSFSSSGSTVTLDVTASCNGMNFIDLDNTMSLTSSVYTLSVYSGFTGHSGATFNFTSTAYIYFKSTTDVDITMNGMAGDDGKWNVVYFDGVGGSWTLQDDFLLGGGSSFDDGIIRLQNGTLNTNGYATISRRLQLYSGTKGINLGSSLITCSEAFYFAYNTSNTSFSGGTAEIRTGAYIGGRVNSQPQFHLYKVTQHVGHWTGNISGVNTKHLSIIQYSALQNLYGNILGDIEVSESLTFSGKTTDTYRLMVAGNTPFTTSTITINSSTTIDMSNVDFRDINLYNTDSETWYDASGVEGGSGDGGGNSGITFTSTQTQYWYDGTGNWSDTKWFLGSGGSGGSGRVPLLQDNIIFDVNSFTSASTVTFDCARIGGDLNMSDVDQDVTISLPTTVYTYGDFILGNNISFSGTKTISLWGRNCVINLHDRELPYGLDCQGTYSCTGDIRCKGIMIYDGIFDFNDYDCYADMLNIGGANRDATIYMGNGTFTLATISYIFGRNAINKNSHGTIYSEGSTIKLEPTGSDNWTILINGDPTTFNKIWFSGTHTGQFIITNSNTISELVIDSGRDVRFTVGTTQQIGTFTAIGTEDEPIILSGVTSGNWTLEKTGGWTVQAEYLNIYDSTVTPTDTWYATNSTDGGGNSGWIFLTGWNYKINGITNYSKINGIAVADIVKINGV